MPRSVKWPINTLSGHYPNLRSLPRLRKGFSVPGAYLVNKACPKCGTAFNVSAQDLGRQFTCFKCNTALVMHQDGLRAAASNPRVAGDDAIPIAAVQLEADAATDAQASTASGPRSGRSPNLATWLFAAGAFLVIVNLFFPLIDQAKLRRANAAVEAGKQREERENREFKDKKDPSLGDQDRARRRVRPGRKKKFG